MAINYHEVGDSTSMGKIEGGGEVRCQPPRHTQTPESHKKIRLRTPHPRLQIVMRQYRVHSSAEIDAESNPNVGHLWSVDGFGDHKRYHSHDHTLSSAEGALRELLI